jgi:hypothetical protein
LVIDILRLFFFFGSEKSTTKREKKKRALVVAFFFSEGDGRILGFSRRTSEEQKFLQKRQTVV